MDSGTVTRRFPSRSRFVSAMHVLVLDHNHTIGLSQALQLSGYGLIVETVPDVEEAARRLSAMAFDVVLYNVPVTDNAGSARIQAFRVVYPDTQFYAYDRIGDFLRRIRKESPAR